MRERLWIEALQSEGSASTTLERKYLSGAAAGAKGRGRGEATRRRVSSARRERWGAGEMAMGVA